MVANSRHAWNRKNLIHQVAVLIPRYGSAEGYNSACDFCLDSTSMERYVS